MGERADIPLPSSGVDLCVILVRPEVPGNIGAIARSMLNFGYNDLRLVASKCVLDSDEVRKRVCVPLMLFDHPPLCSFSLIRRRALLARSVASAITFSFSTSSSPG